MVVSSQVAAGVVQGCQQVKVYIGDLSLMSPLIWLWNWITSSFVRFCCFGWVKGCTRLILLVATSKIGTCPTQYFQRVHHLQNSWLFKIEPDGFFSWHVILYHNVSCIVVWAKSHMKSCVTIAMGYLPDLSRNKVWCSSPHTITSQWRYALEGRRAKFWRGFTFHIHPLFAMEFFIRSSLDSLVK